MICSGCRDRRVVFSTCKNKRARSDRKHDLCPGCWRNLKNKTGVNFEFKSIRKRMVGR